jgi:putative FmdB family regulatory protein
LQLPTYEYRCTKCGHHYEKREGFDAPARQRCSRCGAEARRVIHAPPILFKASGFYVTDNRKSGLVGSSGGSDVESVAGGTGGNGDKESKPETKPAEPAVAESKPSEAPAAG